MRRLDYETVKKVKEILKNKTYKEIEEETGLSSATIAKIAKMSDEEIEELRKKEAREKKIKEVKKDEIYKAKSGKALLKDIQEAIAEESLRRHRELLNTGLFVEKLWEKKKEQEFLNAIQQARIEKTKNLALKILMLRYLRGEIDKRELARRILVVTYA